MKLIKDLLVDVCVELMQSVVYQSRNGNLTRSGTNITWRKTTETHQAVTDRRNASLQNNAKRIDIEEVMGECGGDDDKEGESEDEDEDGEGTRLADNGIETKRRKQRSFYFRSGVVMRTTSHNGSVVTAKCQVGVHVYYKYRTETLKSCKTTFRSVILN